MSEAPYPLHPTDRDLDDESLFTEHTGYRGCPKCETVGAHQWTQTCVCCGAQPSRFYDAEYLEAD